MELRFDAQGQAIITDAKLMYRNFSGREGLYNKVGSRKFSLRLEPEIAEILLDAGWNVKDIDNPEKDPRLEVEVSFKYRPPKIVQIIGDKPTALDEEMLSGLDFAEFSNVDVILNPSHWTNAKKESGIKAYLAKGYFTLKMDPLMEKYGY